MMYESKDINRLFSSSSAAQLSSSGLLRYRSAPSSLLAELSEEFLPIRPSSPETESMFARFLNPDATSKIPPRVSGGSGYPPPTPPPPAPAQVVPTSDEMIFQQQHMLTTSMAMEDAHMKNESSSNLIRHSSSPAGLFANLNFDNGYGVMRGMSGNSGNTGNSSGNSRLKSQLSYPSRQSSVMSQISEMESESMAGGYNHMNSWEESPILSDNNYSSRMKRPRDSQIEHHNGEVRNGLGHQFSLPKTTTEMAAIEKFLQFQDSVPCKVRAKRGCATHPRSIAERVRRTRISERMRKLQELVPNMDKQTNTADMLDLAVDYIKDLQKQVKGLTDSRANCTCSSSSKQRLYMNPQV